MKKILLFAFIITLIISIFTQCAKIVSPSGGPKDTIPPVMVRSNPAMDATNFSGEKVTLTFNEFIILQEYQKKLAISPPMTKNPEIIQRGKNIDIKFKDSLRRNTTYTIYFADAIVDNNENNPIKNFMFAFSTGKSIDSLTLSGKLCDAFTLLPAENVFVMLYEQNIDSLPIKSLPRYLTRTDKNGNFIFQNLQSKDYKVFALVDNNSNYKYDQITEDIAFLDSIVSKDKLMNPSLIDTSRNVVRTLKLNLFKEDSRIQALTGYERKQRRRLSLSFSKTVEGEVNISPLNFKLASSWYKIEQSTNRDSLIYWITNESISSKDTIKVQLSYLKTDSLQRLQPRIDTLKYIFTDPEEPKKRGRDKEKKDPKKQFLHFGSNIKNDEQVIPYKPMELLFQEPIDSINYLQIKLIKLIDSTEIKGIKLVVDSLNPRIYRMYNSWVTDAKYRLYTFPNAFKSYSGLTNDTVKINFVGANPEKYGQIILTLLNSSKQVIAELLNEKKDRVIDTKITKNGDKIVFDYITPGKYTLRFIEDTNENGKWDTGWYLKGIQPEKVHYYFDSKTKGILNIRANWENEITFDITK